MNTVLLKFQNFALKLEVCEIGGNFWLQNRLNLLCRVRPSGQRPKPTHALVSSGRFERFLKGPGSIRGIFGLRFPENLKFLFCVVYINIIKVISHRYQYYAQISVCMFTVAMGTPTNKAEMQFFTISIIFLQFLKLLLKISIPHHARTNIELLL